MDMRIERKTAFYVSGYSVETSEASLEKDCAMLREKHEDKLRSISDHLYFASFMLKDGVIVSPMTEGSVMTYLLGVESTSQNPVTEGAACIEVPATYFAIATVPDGATILTTWHEFFDKGIPSLGATIDMDYNFYLESFDENGVCELWIPVVKSE